MCLFQEYSKFCPLFLASTGLQLVVQKVSFYGHVYNTRTSPSMLSDLGFVLVPHIIWNTDAISTTPFATPATFYKNNYENIFQLKNIGVIAKAINNLIYEKRILLFER